jgi:DNA replication protein DnaC
MLRRIDPEEIILALKPLLVNTPRSPRTADTPTAIATPEDIGRYLDDVQKRMTWVTCPDCNTEWNALTHEGICASCVEARAVREKKQRELGEYLKQTIGPYGIERYSFSSFEKTPLNDYAFRSFEAFDHTRQNLYLYGSPGIGKTHLAGALMKDCCAKNLSVKWANPMYLGMELSGRFPSDQKAIIDGFAAQDVVILDDLGLGEELRAIMKLIYMLTDRRTADKRNGLVITSNLSLEDLAKHFRDDRITSRIAGLCRVIKIDGVDGRVRRSPYSAAAR